MEELTINPNRIELDEAYMQMAEIWARRSKGNRLQVGALIVKDRQIISDGYNGMPAGEINDVCEEWYDPTGLEYVIRTRPEVLHAESNALMKITENGGVGAQGGTLYTTVSPCFECAKLIKQAKITRVVFRNLYRNVDGIELLMSRGVQVEQLAPAPTDSFAELRKPIKPDLPEPARTPPMPTVTPQKLSPVALPGKPSEYKPPAPTVLETPPIPKAAAPVVQEMSEADIAAMIAAAGIPDPTKPATAAKSTLADAKDDGTYRSPFL